MDQERQDGGRIHIIDEDECDILLTVRIAKAWLVANMNFITAMFELTNLLDDDQEQG